jgi:dihydroorotate dehydrogenase
MIELTRRGKNALTVENPVMPAAGTLGYGDLYRDLIDIEKLGALVTNPVTYQPWSPATGTRVVPLHAGVLMHTGLPNPGLSKIVAKYRGLWRTLPVPVIVHVVGTSISDIQQCMALLDEEDSVAAIELGLNDDISPADAESSTLSAVEATEKPVIVRLPFTNVEVLAQTVADSEAGALVISSPPRGTARDVNGRLMSGRVYGPVVKPLVLRIVGQLARRLDVPIIGAGGIHSPEDARDYMEAGARAVQVDSVTWIKPNTLEMIARDLGGLVLTQPAGALLDEWHPGIGETERSQRKRKRASRAGGEGEHEEKA